MKEINVCPSTLRKGLSSFSPQALNSLFDGKKVSHIFRQPKPTSLTQMGNEIVKGVGRISLSGVQSKYSLTLDSNEGLRYCKEGEQGLYILKPCPTGSHIINKEYCAANEHLTMQLASQVYGIDTAPNALVFFEEDGSMAYLTRRFDIVKGQKRAQEDFAALLGYSRDLNGSDYKYSLGSYEECGEIIRKYVKASLPDLRRFFRLILFNFLTLNDDAHLKNFSLLEVDGEYRLSPAYDLINTSLQIWEPGIFALRKGLFKEGMNLSDTRWIRRQDFEEFGKRLGLPGRVIDTDLELFIKSHSKAIELINNSFLSEDLKRSYLEGYDYRRRMLTF